MTYNTALPHIDNILWLRALARPFPTTAGRILDIAATWNFSKNTLSFLSLFPHHEVFENGNDFLSRCEQLELLIRDERAMPVEHLNSQE